MQIRYYVLSMIYGINAAGQRIDDVLRPTLTKDLF
jgi:hypothetical protein